jgi:hypothetical protein
MRCLEGSSVPVLYIGRTVPKGEIGMSQRFTAVTIGGEKRQQRPLCTEIFVIDIISRRKSVL